MNPFFLLKNPFNELLMQSSPLQIIYGKVNLSSIHTNFAPIRLGVRF